MDGIGRRAAAFNNTTFVSGPKERARYRVFPFVVNRAIGLGVTVAF